MAQSCNFEDFCGGKYFEKFYTELWVLLKEVRPPKKSQTKANKTPDQKRSQTQNEVKMCQKTKPSLT